MDKSRKTSKQNPSSDQSSFAPTDNLTTVREALPALLLNFRHRKSMTQEALARLLAIGRATVAAIETARPNACSDHNAARIYRQVSKWMRGKRNLPLAELHPLSGTSNPKSNPPSADSASSAVVNSGKTRRGKLTPEIKGRKCRECSRFGDTGKPGREKYTCNHAETQRKLLYPATKACSRFEKRGDLSALAASAASPKGASSENPKLTEDDIKKILLEKLPGHKIETLAAKASLIFDRNVRILEGIHCTGSLLETVDNVVRKAFARLVNLRRAMADACPDHAFLGPYGALALQNEASRILHCPHAGDVTVGMAQKFLEKPAEKDLEELTCG